MKNIILAIAILFAPIAAQAADAAPMECSAKNVGAVQCMAQKECECKFFRKSEMAGTPDRFSWDCSLLRPACLDYQHIDTTKPYDGPNSVIIDKNNSTQTH